MSNQSFHGAGNCAFFKLKNKSFSGEEDETMEMVIVITSKEDLSSASVSPGKKTNLRGSESLKQKNYCLGPI